LIVVPLSAIVVAGCGGSTKSGVGQSAAGHVAAGPGNVCQSDPLAGVHDPDRLTVLQKCATFVGTVSRAPALNPSDGDVTFNATPDPAYVSILNAANRAEGGLHLEIVPRDQPGCTPGQPVTVGSTNNLGNCSGLDVVFPPLGAHVRVTGTWVLDTSNNWNEIHPVWKVEILPPSGPVPPEKHVFKASLVGVAKSGARRAAGAATVTTTGSRLCWSIAVRPSAGKPTRAVIRRNGASGATQLGSRYAPKGCLTATEGAAESLFQQPESYSVTVYTPRYKIAQGALRHASD
jgi:hypothetical protein